MTVTDAAGVGRQRGQSATYRGAEYGREFLPKLRVEVLVTDADLQRVTDALVAAVHTGKIGDGKVWVTAVEDLVRIRTGERGLEAL